MREQKVAGITMSPSPSTENGYCFEGSLKLGNKNLTGASMRVATVIWSSRRVPPMKTKTVNGYGKDGVGGEVAGSSGSCRLYRLALVNLSHNLRPVRAIVRTFATSTVLGTV